MYDGGMKERADKMTTMNISLPESLRKFADERASGRYGSASEYIRELIRRDQKDAAREKLEDLLIEGLESGDPIVVTEDYWEKKRQDLTARHGKKTRR